MSNYDYGYEKQTCMMLEGALGDKYEVLYDDCESGQTRLFYAGIRYMVVPNGTIKRDCNVNDYRAPQDLLYDVHYGTHFFKEV